MKHIKLFEQFIAEKQSVITATGVSKEVKEVLIKGGHDVKVVGPGHYITVDDSEKKEVIDYLKKSGAEVNESDLYESLEYAVVLTGGSIGDKPRPRDAKGYIGMDAGKEELYSLDKATEKAKRMNNNVLTPGERKHYGLKYIVVPVKAGKFITESTILNDITESTTTNLGPFKSRFRSYYGHIDHSMNDSDIQEFLAQPHITKQSLNKQVDLFADYLISQGLADITESTYLSEYKKYYSFNLSTNEYPAGSVARYRLESNVINLRKVANLSNEPWSKNARAFDDNELGFESASDRKTAMTAIKKSFDNGSNDIREYILENVLNEATFLKVSFNSHIDHNPSADILEGHIDKDSYITYGIYVNGPEKGTEFMEYYSGENYKPGSTKRSNSKYFEASEIPKRYKSLWDSLKATYKTDYAGKNKPSTRNTR